MSKGVKFRSKTAQAQIFGSEWKQSMALESPQQHIIHPAGQKRDQNTSTKHKNLADTRCLLGNGAYTHWEFGGTFPRFVWVSSHCKVQMKSTQIVATCPKFVSVSPSTCLVTVSDFPLASSRARLLIILYPSQYIIAPVRRS